MARRRATEAAEASITVKLAPAFGEVKEFAVPKDTTLGDFLAEAGYSRTAEARVNSEGVLPSDSVLEDGDKITIVAEKKIENGR